MTFRDREKKRLVPLKSQLFSPDACEPGMYKGHAHDFCLRDDRSCENLHSSIRDEAIEYFTARGIPWHDGKQLLRAKDRPSNHLCCSQSACVNFWFPFARRPQELASVLRALGYDVEEVLPFALDRTSADQSTPYIAFEWIGARNYLGELSHGKVAADHLRKRGAGFTSLDFAVRFRERDGRRIHIVAGEWKYTEYYTVGANMRFSSSNTDRLGVVYGALFDRSNCHVRKGVVSPESLFFDPFDQLMRQQLLASAMEGESEMAASVVSLLHVAPHANTELMQRITSPALAGLGADIHAVWSNLTREGKFRGVAVEDLLTAVTSNAPDPAWADYMRLRYGGMA